MQECDRCKRDHYLLLNEARKLSEIFLEIGFLHKKRSSIVEAGILHIAADVPSDHAKVSVDCPEHGIEPSEASYIIHLSQGFTTVHLCLLLGSIPPIVWQILAWMGAGWAEERRSAHHRGCYTCRIMPTTRSLHHREVPPFSNHDQ